MTVRLPDTRHLVWLSFTLNCPVLYLEICTDLSNPLHFIVRDKDQVIFQGLSSHPEVILLDTQLCDVAGSISCSGRRPLRRFALGAYFSNTLALSAPQEILVAFVTSSTMGKLVSIKTRRSSGCLLLRGTDL